MSTAIATAKSTSNGIGFIGLLTLLFIGAKIFGFITWSWFWILSPLFFGFLLWVFVVIVIILLALAANR